MVGDSFDISFKQESSGTEAVLSNKFGVEVGRLDAAAARRVQLACARGWSVRALLSFVAYSDEPAPGCYWGSMAIVSYAPELAAPFETFCSALAAKLADGVRPQIDLGEQGVQRVLETNGSWLPSKTEPLPEKTQGFAIIKARRLFSERMIEQGRKGNPGCYAVSIGFIIAVIALIAWGALSIFSS